MKIESGSIALRLLVDSDLEQVRKWRNSEAVRTNMIYQDYITRESQLAWFLGLDKKCNLYYVIELNGIPVGVCNLKDIDWCKSVGEGGVFIGETSCLNTTVPVKSILLFLNYLFFSCNIRTVTLRIRKENVVSKKIVEAFGATLITDEKECHQMAIIKDAFVACDLRKRFSAFLKESRESV